MSAEDFAWANRAPYIMVSVVRGATAERVLAGWGVGHAEPVRCAYRDVASLIPKEDPGERWTGVAIRERGGGLIEVWEPSGAEGTRPAVLTSLADRGVEMLSVCATEGARTQFAYAADGSVLATMSSLTPGELAGSDPDRLRPAMARAGVAVEWLSRWDCLRLVAELFGIVLVAPGGADPVLGTRVERYPDPAPYVPGPPPRTGPAPE